MASTWRKYYVPQRKKTAEEVDVKALQGYLEKGYKPVIRYGAGGGPTRITLKSPGEFPVEYDKREWRFDALYLVVREINARQRKKPRITNEHYTGEDYGAGPLRIGR